MNETEKPRHALCPACGKMSCEHLAAELEQLRAERDDLARRLQAQRAATAALVGGVEAPDLVDRALAPAPPAALRPTTPTNDLRSAAQRVLDEIDALAAESNGVLGLHRNGDLATWDWLYEEWLGSLATLRTALRSDPNTED